MAGRNGVLFVGGPLEALGGVPGQPDGGVEAEGGTVPGARVGVAAGELGEPPAPGVVVLAPAGAVVVDVVTAVVVGATGAVVVDVGAPVVVVVAPAGAAQVELVIVLVSRVTAPSRARSRPRNVAPVCAVIDA